MQLVFLLVFITNRKNIRNSYLKTLSVWLHVVFKLLENIREIEANEKKWARNKNASTDRTNSNKMINVLDRIYRVAVFHTVRLYFYQCVCCWRHMFVCETIQWKWRKPKRIVLARTVQHGKAHRPSVHTTESDDKWEPANKHRFSAHCTRSWTSFFSVHLFSCCNVTVVRQ